MMWSEQPSTHGMKQSRVDHAMLDSPTGYGVPKSPALITRLAIRDRVRRATLKGISGMRSKTIAVLCIIVMAAYFIFARIQLHDGTWQSIALHFVTASFWVMTVNLIFKGVNNSEGRPF